LAASALGLVGEEPRFFMAEQRAGGPEADDRGIVLRGFVRSGRGDFGFWLAKLEAYYRTKTGMTLFPGTLNLESTQPFRCPNNPIRLEGNEYGGAVSVSIVPCRVFGRRAFILRTDANEQGTGDHPPTIIEIATDRKLRDAYHLTDGDLVEVEL
jgi:riboflavin kinase, archaea type